MTSLAHDRLYFERREMLYQALKRHGSATCAELADDLGWRSTEVAVKLTSLRRDGMARLELDQVNVWHAAAQA